MSRQKEKRCLEDDFAAFSLHNKENQSSTQSSYQPKNKGKLNKPKNLRESFSSQYERDPMKIQQQFQNKPVVPITVLSLMKKTNDPSSSSSFAVVDSMFIYLFVLFINENRFY